MNSNIPEHLSFDASHKDKDRIAETKKIKIEARLKTLDQRLESLKHSTANLIAERRLVKYGHKKEFHPD
jgi:hypothetical protein